MCDTVTQVSVIDRNDFNRVLVCRMFRHASSGKRWGEELANKMAEEIKAKDPNELADIEMQWRTFDVDDYMEPYVRPQR